MIRSLSGRVTLPQSTPAQNLAQRPGQSQEAPGTHCWTIIKYDGVVECCVYPGEAYPVCLYISVYDPSDPNVVGPNGLAIAGTRAQRTRMGSATLVGRGTSSPAASSLQRQNESSITTGSSRSTTRIGGGDRNVATR